MIYLVKKLTFLISQGLTDRWGDSVTSLSYAYILKSFQLLFLSKINVNIIEFILLITPKINLEFISRFD